MLDSAIRKSRNEIEYAKFQKELTEKLESEGTVKKYKKWLFSLNQLKQLRII